MTINGTALAFQKVEQLPQATWPNGPHPQLRLDLTVPNRAELVMAHQRALVLRAQTLMDRSDNEEEPLRSMPTPRGLPSHGEAVSVVPIEQSLPWITLQELRDELDRTRANTFPVSLVSVSISCR